MERWRRVGTVVFDCDSTLSSIEGITSLAGARECEIQALTDAAMAGEVPLEEVYGRRLALVKPTRDQIEALGDRYIENVVEDARDVVTALRLEGIEVAIVSGGVRQAVVAVGAALGIPAERVAAVDVVFDGHGDYAGYDARSPLARSGGKRDLLRAWRGELPPPLLLVGDGVTDAEARPVVDVFVAYTGVVERGGVVAAADAVIHSRSLAPVLPLALAGQPPRFASKELFRKGMQLLDEGLPALLTNTT